MSAHDLAAPPDTLRPRGSSRSRTGTDSPRRAATLVVAGIGLLGATATVTGVTLPWITTFRGLIGQPGWGSRNGTVLLVLAAVIALLAVAQLLRGGGVTLRWALALAGFATAGFAGYLAIEVHATLGSTLSDSMLFASAGPGLPVAAAGGVLAVVTIFLPQPVTATATRPDLADRPAGGPARRVTTLPGLTALRSPWRIPAALLALVAGLAHVPVTPAHLQEAPYVGVLFVLLTVVCVLGATGLLVADTAVAWGGLALACALAVTAYVVSRSLGLPLMADDVGQWLEPLGVVSVLTETGVVVTALLTWRRTRGH